MREHEWINTPEARQRRGERSLFAIEDALHALHNGKPIPENAARVLDEISRETARADAWRILGRIRRDNPPDLPPPPEPPTEPQARDWDETPAEAARYDRAHFDRDED